MKGGRGWLDRRSSTETTCPTFFFMPTALPVLADLGICHADGDQRVTLTDEAMGSTNYVAPDMESGRRLGSPTDRTDVYSLGKVLYRVLSGGHVFGREDHRARPLADILGDRRFKRRAHPGLEWVTFALVPRRCPARVLEEPSGRNGGRLVAPSRPRGAGRPSERKHIPTSRAQGSSAASVPSLLLAAGSLSSVNPRSY
jgi:serine/threonine protein kinase